MKCCCVNNDIKQKTNIYKGDKSLRFSKKLKKKKVKKNKAKKV